MAKIPEDIFLPLNIGRSKRSNTNPLVGIPNNSISLKNWLKANNIIGHESASESKVFVENEVIDIEDVFDINTSPSGFDKPLTELISSVVGTGLPFTGTKVLVSQLINSTVFGNPSGTPNDTLIEGLSLVGNLDIGLLSGSPLPQWAPFEYRILKSTNVASGLVLFIDLIVETNSNITVYKFDVTSGTLHIFRTTAINDSANAVPNDKLVNIDNTGTITDLGGRYGSIPKVIQANMAAIEITSNASTSSTNIKYAFNCKNTDIGAADIVVEVWTGGALSFTATHPLDPENGTTSGAAFIPYASLAADTWYKVKFLLNVTNVSGYANVITSTVTNTAVFKTNGTNDAVEASVCLLNTFPLGVKDLTHLRGDFTYTVITETGLATGPIQSPVTIGVNSLESYNGGSDIQTNLLGVTYALAHVESMNVQPSTISGVAQDQKVIKHDLLSVTLNGWESCPYNINEIATEAYFWYTLNDVVFPTNP
jgi:hypothetical protein